MVSEKQMHLAGAAGGQLPAGIAGEKEKTNQGGWFYFTLAADRLNLWLRPSGADAEKQRTWRAGHTDPALSRGEARTGLGLALGRKQALPGARGTVSRAVLYMRSSPGCI